MNFNWMFVPTLFLALSLFALGSKLVSRVNTRPAFLAIWVVAIILALPSLLFIAYYRHMLDDAIWFYALRSAPGSELLASGIGFLLGILNGLSQKRAKAKESKILVALSPAFLLILLAITIFLPYLKMVFIPMQSGMQDRWKGDICIQSSSSTCGPASAATLLNFFGTRVSELTLAKESFSCGSGTENWYLARALRRRGLTATYLQLPHQPDHLEFPAIAGTELGGKGGGGHFIAILGKEGDLYRIGDPISGENILTLDQLKLRFYFTGFFIKLEKG